MTKLRIAFTDFWPDFDPENNFLTDTLRQIQDIEIVNPDAKPQLLIYSIFGYDNLKHFDSIRLYYTGENDVPDFNLCDYAISFHHISYRNRHLRQPIYVRWQGFNNLRDRQRMPLPKQKRGFCSYVVSNNWCSDPIRTQIFEELSKYKFVASGGRHANNIGGPVKDKLDFLNKYKFNIAFENSRVEGYTTEKIVEALAARTVPIYWGDPLVNIDINPRSFINISDFASLSEAIEYIKQVDADNALYESYLDADPVDRNGYLDWEDQLRVFLTIIIEQGQRHIPDYGLGAKFHQNVLEKEELYHSKHIRNLLKSYKHIISLKKRLFR